MTAELSVDDGGDLSGLSNSQKVLKVISMAEGPITFAGIHARPGIASAMSPDDLRDELHNLVSEGHVRREDMSGQRSTYAINGNGAGTSAAIPKTVALPTLDASVLTELRRGPRKRSELMQVTRADPNDMATTLGRLFRRGAIQRCHPYGSYKIADAKAPETKAAEASAAPAPELDVPAFLRQPNPARAAATNAPQLSSSYDAVIDHLEAEARRLNDMAAYLRGQRDAA